MASLKGSWENWVFLFQNIFFKFNYMQYVWGIWNALELNKKSNHADVQPQCTSVPAAPALYSVDFVDPVLWQNVD